MAEQQKIHPLVDVEAPRPTSQAPAPAPAPVMPTLAQTQARAPTTTMTTLAPVAPTAAKATLAQAPVVTMPSLAQAPATAVPTLVKAGLPLHQAIRANIPVVVPPIAKPEKKSRGCLCKTVCWTLSLLVLLLVLVGATIGILFLVFQPKVPKYSVDSLKISDLRLNYDMSLYAKFNVKVTANNPNKKIGIYYEKGSKLSVWYTNTKLCQGSLPRFYQGHQNVTKLDVSLTGESQYGTTLLKAIQEQQQTGRIPLNLKIDAPVAIKLGKMKLRKVRVLGHCLLVVDSLSTNNLIRIKASDCSFKLKL